MQKRILFLLASLLAITIQVTAQITSSSMSGKVTLKSTGETAVGATVIAVHEPSGTRYASVSNADGRYNIQGMRVGGPYRISVSYVGFSTRNYTGVNLSLGENYNLNVALSEDESVLDEIVVSGKTSRFSTEKTGASTNLTNQQIMEMPTVTRSITDYVRMSPYANGMSLGGADGRTVNFRLDGADFNNNFGLSSSLPGGGTPISMDAIEEMQMAVSPFDVRETNFMGGNIHAITKSGTNTLKGTAYVYYNNENMHGNRVDDLTMADPGRDRLTTYGFTLGGPILKDKLFFFANYEHVFKPTVVNRWRASDDGVANPTEFISRTKKSDMENVRNFLAENYGYDTGSYTDFPADETNDKYLLRLDWNINNDHHLALRYSYTQNESWMTCNNSSADVGTRFTGNRVSQYSMAFANNFYSLENKITSVSADLNSRFGANMNNQFTVTYSDIRDERGSNSAPFPHIDILAGYTTTADGTVTQTLEPYMSLGYELFTWNNAVKNQALTVNDNFTYYLGNHKIMAGFAYEHQMALNSYMRNGTGYYRYRSLDDFLSGAAPESVSLTYGYNGDKNPAAEVNKHQYGFYFQDEWNVLTNLKLTGGVRFDNIVYDDKDIMRNNAIYEVDFNGRHVDTGKWPDSNIQISPRLGFNWDVFGNKTLKVRGGTGIFTGRLPLVFFTNMPTNSGMVQNLATATTRYKNGVVTSRDERLDKFAGRIVTDVDQMIELLGTPTTITPAEGVLPSAIVGVDKNFKMSQEWKSTLAVDYQLPVSFPLTLTGELTYTDMLEDVCLENWNIKEAEGWSRLAGADNRMIYPSDYMYHSDITTACVLTNTHKGYGWLANITLNAEPIKDLRIMAAYTHTVRKEISGMPGSNASSAWSSLYTVDGPNYSSLHNTSSTIPNRVIASVSYKYGKDHYSIFYSGYSPSGYSFYYNGDVNGDGIAYDLMYIPRDDSEIHFTNDADRPKFWAFVNQDKYLRNHRGQYAEAYSAFAPFVHRFDVHYAHDFTLKVGNTRHTLQVIADIDNAGNLFNSKWGVSKNMSTCQYGSFLKVDKVDANGVPWFSMRKNADGTDIVKTWDYNHSYGQCWKIQIGVKYYFN